MTEESLREVVSRLARIDTGNITASSTLVGALGGSIGFAKLDAVLRSKLGISNPAIYGVATYGELCKVLGIESSPDTANAQAGSVPAVLPIRIDNTYNNLSIGVDVESVAAMHVVADYWEDDFYKNTFTAQEIAYAILQVSPQASFAAMWCAKEALRKADISMAQAAWQRLEVAHDANGRPYIKVDGQPVAGALSLSHTDEIAFAIVVALPQSQQQQLQPTPPSTSLLQTPMGLPRIHNYGNAIILAILALLSSIAALAVALFHH